MPTLDSSFGLSNNTPGYRAVPSLITQESQENAQVAIHGQFRNHVAPVASEASFASSASTTTTTGARVSVSRYNPEGDGSISSLSRMDISNSSSVWEARLDPTAASQGKTDKSMPMDDSP
jgi:hypothetical protein